MGDLDNRDQWLAQDNLETQFQRRTWPLQGEFREDGSGMHFRGYAAVFNSPSEPLPFIEEILPGAFKRTLKSRHQKFFINHNTDLILGSVKAGTLRLTEDSHGLEVDADLPDTSYARDLSVSMRRGDVDEMSFAFTVPANGDEWKGSKRFLREVNAPEVSVVTGFPAYKATEAYVRKLAVELALDAETLDAALKALTSDYRSLTLEQREVLYRLVTQHGIPGSRDKAQITVTDLRSRFLHNSEPANSEPLATTSTEPPLEAEPPQVVA